MMSLGLNSVLSEAPADPGRGFLEFFPRHSSGRAPQAPHAPSTTVLLRLLLPVSPE